MKISPLSPRFLALFLLAFSLRSAVAGSATWTGAAADSDWLNAANWTPATVPGTGDTATFGATAAPAVVAAGVSLRNLQFAADAPACSLSGSLTMDSGASITTAAGGSATQTVAALTTFSGGAAVSSDAAGLLDFSTGIFVPAAAGSTLTFDGTGSTSIFNVNSGAASNTVFTRFVKNGTGTVLLPRSNTCIGGAVDGDGFTVNAGTLAISDQNGAGNRVINLGGGVFEGRRNNGNSQFQRMSVTGDATLFYSQASNQWQLGAAAGVLVSTGTPVLTLDTTLTSAIRFNLNTQGFNGTWKLSDKAIIRLSNASTGGSGIHLDMGSGPGTHILENLAAMQDTTALTIREIPFGALSSAAPDAILRGKQGANPQTMGTQYRIGALNTDTVYAGLINDGTALNGNPDGTAAGSSTWNQGNGPGGANATTELVKTGTGTLRLTNPASTYSGGTVISGGILEVAADGCLGAAWDGTLRHFSCIPGGSSTVISFTARPSVTLTGGGGSGAVLSAFFSTGSGTVPANNNTLYLTFGSTVSNNTQTGSGYTSNPAVAITGPGNTASGSVRVKGLLTLDGGTLRPTAPLTSGRATVLAAGGGTFDSNGFDSTLSGTVSGPGGLTKTGAGSLTIGGAAYDGPTQVNAGTLVLNGSLSSAITVAAGATLGGTAVTTGTVAVSGTLAPGQSAGAFGAGTLVLGGGSACAFEIADWTGTAGTGYDTVNAGALDIAATAASPVTIRIRETVLANFDGTSGTFTLVAAAGGITGFAADKFVIDSSGFTSGAGPWSVAVSGNSLVLHYTGSASAYDTWAAALGLTGPAAAKSADPDNDGVSNIAEFGFNSSPAAGSAPGGPGDGGVKAVSGGDALTLTIRVRAGAVFSGATALTAVRDGVKYTIEGSTNLAAWTADIDEVTPALSAGLPAPDAGWEYRTFRFADTTAATARAMIRAAAAE